MGAFRDIIKDRALRPKAAVPKWAEGRRIVGYDTETSAGNVILVTRSRPGKEPDAIHQDGAELDPVDLWASLCHRDSSSALNVWYNLDFDANVLLKVLPAPELFRLQLTRTTEWEGARITYLPRKLLKIQMGKKVWAHYDASQFFFSSLERAASTWLGESKADDGLDVTRFDDPEYIREHWDRIVYYGKKDADLVRRLFTRFAEASEALDVPVGQPFSTGYIAEQTANVRFRRAGEIKPRQGPLDMQALGWDAYRGGRFEILERGDVGRVVTADINSAYPHVLRTLPDPASLLWTHHQAPSWSELDRHPARYGFVRARVWTNPDRPVQPFPVKSDRVTFPVLEGREIATELETFRWAVRHGFVLDADVSEAWLGEADDRTRYPWTWLEELYTERKRLQAEGEREKQLVLKIIINSVYGKLCQVTRKRALVKDPREAVYYPFQALPPHIREWVEGQGLFVTEKLKAGAYFNPFLAAHVTGLTRLELVRTAWETGTYSDILMLATDSLTLRESGYDGSTFPELIGPGLGGWELEARGPAFVIGSGVYEIQDEISGKLKTRTRGFEPGGGSYRQELGEAGLRRTAEQFADSDTIEITTVRPLKLPQIIWQGADITDVGKFVPQIRGIHAGMDQKRRWDSGSEIPFRDLLGSREKSSPLVVGPG